MKENATTRDEILSGGVKGVLSVMKRGLSSRSSRQMVDCCDVERGMLRYASSQLSGASDAGKSASHLTR